MRSVSSSIFLPVSANAAFRVITDLSTLIRLSPFFTLKHIEPPTGRSAQKGDRCRLTVEYYENKLIETHGVEIDRLEIDRLISYTIENGAVKNIRYELQPAGAGVQLTQTFELDSENEAIIKGTQDEIAKWLRSVGNYLKLGADNSALKKALKWFMDRVWLRLTLSERTIAIIMIKISVLELVLLLFLVLIWNIGIRI
ncbi:MAG: SRPBCC family protein [Nitrospirae bacterium]|nr:SRPBCC family protein [Nitrospirota bacterium]